MFKIEYFCKMKQVLLFTILTFVTIISYSQSANDSIYRPKIGLVLSGGGAKGIAHIGVLKILESYGIHPDYITGTSMGSIMGGLYASGYTAIELDSIIRNIDWNVILSDKISLDKVVPEEKNEYQHYLIEFDLTKKGPLLPKGMVIGQGISEELNYLTWHVSDIDDFDDLPIPFRCVASDLISGNPYVFHKGNLATAMRASLAIPSVFSPVEYNNMLLVDGGVLDNLPVQACKDMGADIIIAVNVGLSQLPKTEDFKSIADVLMGSAMIKSNSETVKALKDVDLLIQPDLQNYSVASFFNGPEIIQLGEDAALQHIDELEALADYLNQFPPQKVTEKPPIIKELYIEDVQVENLKHLNQNFVLGKFGIQKGHSYTKKQIEDGLHLLIGTRYIDNISYSLTKGENGYIITLKPIESYPSKYNFSIHYNNTYKASAILNIALRNYILSGSSIKASLDISEYPQFSIEFLDHLGLNQNVGPIANLHWEKNLTPYHDSEGSNLGNINQRYFEAQGGFFVTPNFKRMVTTGLYYKRFVMNTGSSVLNLLVDDIGKIGNESWGAMLIYNKNSLNDPHFPNKGMRFDTRFDYPFYVKSIFNGSDESYEILKDLIDIPNKQYLKISSSYRQYITLSPKWNFNYSANLGYATKSMGTTEYFNIGGIEESARQTDIPLIGFINKEVSAQQFIMGGVNFRYSPINNLYLTASSYLLNYKTNFNEINYSSLRNFKTSDLIYCFGFKAAYQSFLGPIVLGYGRNTMYSNNNFYFSVGYAF